MERNRERQEKRIERERQQKKKIEREKERPSGRKAIKGWRKSGRKLRER